MPLRWCACIPLSYCERTDSTQWDGLNYGIIYLAVESIVLIYAQCALALYGVTPSHARADGFNDVQSNLVFFSFIIGYIIGIATFPLQIRAVARIEARKGEDVPEAKVLYR